MAADWALRLRGIRYSYRETARNDQVLKGIDLEMRRGECVALLGPSGSGKTTLLNLIAGIDRPDQGEIHVAGQRVDLLQEPDTTLFRRRHIGFIYQFFNLIPTLRVGENVCLSMELNGVSAAKARERSRHLLSLMGLGDRLESFPDQLSGGEQQRVAIARALAHQPALVLADEPTGNLDASTGHQVLKLLTELRHQGDQSLLLVTHNLQVARSADRLLTLRDGLVEAADDMTAW